MPRCRIRGLLRELQVAAVVARVEAVARVAHHRWTTGY